MNKVIHRWHTHLDMPKKDIDWHRQDIADELLELEEARGLVNRWSELSDVSYTYTRALWSGHTEIKLPIGRIYYYTGLIYMFPKYYLRWKFFFILGRKFDKNIRIRQVRNPKKIEKLEKIAGKYDIDPKAFVVEAKKLMKKRIFLK